MKKLLVGIDMDRIGGNPSGRQVYLVDVKVLDEKDEDEGYTQLMQANSLLQAKQYFIVRYFKGRAYEVTEDQIDDVIKRIESEWGYEITFHFIGDI